MKTTYIFLLALFAVVTAGCDAVSNQLSKLAVTNKPTLVFSPGYTINVDGQAVSIGGLHNC